MEKFVFSNPTCLIFGKDTIKRIGKEIKKRGVKNVLVLYGSGSILKNGVYDATIKSLKDNEVGFIQLGGIKPNPVLSKVYEGIKTAMKEKTDGILAIGGGSVIDTAKAVAAGIGYDGDVWDLFEGKAPVKTSVPIFTILTISATGSEMNSGAVITNEGENKKWSIGSPDLFPKVSIIDPSVQFSLPWNQTANGAVDAITHVLELYFDKTESNMIMDEYSHAIVKTVIRSTESLMKNPSDYDAGANLALSATLALNQTNSMGRQGGDWSSHWIEHSLSAFYDVAHGAGLAIVMPAWMEYVYAECMHKWVVFAESIFGITTGTPDEKAKAGIAELKKFYKKIQQPTTLKEINIPYEDLPKIAANASLKGKIGNMKRLDQNDILNILKLAY